MRHLVFVWDIWLENPIWGSGIGSYRQLAESLGSGLKTPDNMFALTLAELGLVGVAGLCALLVWIGSTLAEWRHREKRDKNKCSGVSGLLRPIFAGYIGFIVTMLTWDALRFPVTRIMFWLIAGIGLAWQRQLNRNA